MKKYILRIALLLGCLCILGFATVQGQTALETETKIWSRSIDMLDKDPDGNGKKEFDKILGQQLERWTVEKSHIPLIKNGLFVALDKQFANSETPAKGLGVANDVMFERLKDLATGRSHRVVRYNAVLMIGELNSFKKRGGNTAPYTKARPFLKEIATSGDALLQVAALKGLARHATCGVKSEEERADLAKVFSTFAFAPLAKGEANEAPEAQWNRLISIEALGDLGDAGKNGEIAKGLLESATRQNKDLESPYFRRDMERRIVASVAFSKLRLSSDVLKAIGKKPADITSAFYKLFLQCMIYEYNHDYDLQEGVEGEVQRSPRSRQMAQQMARQMSPEEEVYQIRLWKQRTKSISSAFAWIFNDKDSAVKKMEEGNATFSKVARQVRGISEMYDRAGLSKRRAGARSDENMEDGGAMPVETSMYSTMSTKLSLYSMQKDMRKALREVAELMEIPVDIPAKRTATSMY